MTADSGFSYDSLVTRNIGFVSLAEQNRLRGATVLVAGLGGMGGVAVECLARAGVGRFLVADGDRFEVSNLNRQLFSTLDVIGREKTDVTRARIASINPDCRIEILNGDWTTRLTTLLPEVDVAINGCDDVRATLSLMRAARQARRTVVDAFASTLPNVYVVGPDDPRPEELLGYPTVGQRVDQIGEPQLALCKLRELEWVLTHSSSADHVDPVAAGQMLRGERPRISFAPMVWLTGCLMAYESVRTMLGRPGGPGARGFFLNPWNGRIERPRGPLSAAVRRLFVRRWLSKLLGGNEGA